MEEIRLDAAAQALDPNAQHVLVNAARSWVQRTTIAPPDSLRLLNTTTDARATVYEIEVDVAGTIDHLNVSVDDNGTVQVRPAE